MHISEGHLNVLDLFSGIGGFSKALQGAIKTHIYCDLDEDCRNILRKHFDKKRNPPLFLQNVKNIDKKCIEKNPIFTELEMICAGFPCIDISVANYKGKGLEGEYSGLFSEIIRIIDLLPNIKVLFLENSPQIRTKGLEQILCSLKKRKFSCIWTYIHASDVGALHKRKRWYCLCIKLDNSNIIDKIKTVSYRKNIENFDWNENKDEPRILKTDQFDFLEKKRYMKRCAMLGNSIVPQCAAYAWNKLVEEFKNLIHKMIKNEKKSTIQTEIIIPPIKQNTIQLSFFDGKNRFVKNRWATPVRSIWHMFSGISSKRCETTLVVQILFEKNTKIKKDNKSSAYNKYIVNPRFIEHLMGYPKDWTKLY